MTRLRYVPKGRNAQGVVEMTVAPDRNALCKECNEEPRLHGSSRGQRCKDAYWKGRAVKDMQDTTLAKKIAAQRAKA